MDNVKKFLLILKKYQFWVTSGVVLVTSIVCWWLATIGLAGQFQQRKAKLDSAFKSVVVQRNHPNQSVIDKIHQQNDALKRNVYDAWQILYREQKEKNPFPKLLGEDFKRQFENLKPKEELAPEYRELYQNFIMGHFPSLLKMIDVRRPPDEAPAAAADAGRGAVAAPGGRRDIDAPRLDRRAGLGMVPGAFGPGGRPPMGQPQQTGGVEQDWVGMVDWNENDQKLLKTRFEWQERPSTLAVVLAQEDLWVYEALLRIIRNTNEGATTYTTAAVKRIEALEVGRDAAKAWRDAEETIFRAGQTGAAGVPGPMLGGEMMGAPGGTPGTAGASNEEQNRRILIEGRYVDDKGKPLLYEPEYPYAKHPYAEFKMMPIHMYLEMDQRRLPKLLVECANSNMPIEVRRIRFRKGQGGGVLDLAPAAPGAGGGFPAPGGGPRPGMGGGGVRAGGEKTEGGRFDIPVEIYGVIYIYNPPDREKLGTGTASAEKPGEAAATEAPAAAPPAPATPAAPSKP